MSKREEGADYYPRKGEAKGYRGTILRFARAMGRTLVEDGDVEGLADLAAVADLVDEVLAQTVRDMRALHGYSWADVGNAFGITRAAACNRFGAQHDTVGG